ncbi:restriction endonuclease subunit S [Enterococcus faecalis]|uniref:restriction endonuclease subunit S n=1 Tax=Enterococcus faecalis TaxID=1351 RepID=UPI0034CFC3D5
MRDEMKKVPRLRFRGFQEDWELCKLGTLAEIVRGASPRPIQDSKWFDNTSDVGWLRISDVTEQNGRIYKLEQKLSKAGQEKTRVLRKPHLLLSIAATVGKPVVNYVNTGVHDGFLIFLNPLFDREFMFQWLEMFTSKWQKYGQPGSQVNLNSELVRNQELRIPSTNEQEKIGTLFKQLDDTITLHQRKLDQLKELKKAYLQVMFPVKDERVPKVRFAAFEDDWKLCKLGSILEERNEQMAENNEYYLMSFVQGKGVTPKGDRYDRSFLVKDEKKKYKKTEFGDFIYSSNNLERGSIGFNRTGKALISPVYSIFKSKNQLESQFIGILSERKSFINRMTKFRQGVVYGQWRIHEADFLNVEVRIPSHMEQKGIIKFFSNLDNMIIVHQNKLNQLKTLKKSYLQNMFV